MLTIADLVADCVYMPDDFVIRALKKDVNFQLNEKDCSDGVILDALCKALKYYMPENDFEDWFNITFEVK